MYKQIRNFQLSIIKFIITFNYLSFLIILIELFLKNRHKIALRVNRKSNIETIVKQEQGSGAA